MKYDPEHPSVQDAPASLAAGSWVCLHCGRASARPHYSLSGTCPTAEEEAWDSL